MVLTPGVAASQITRYLGGGGGPVTGPTPEVIATTTATVGVSDWTCAMPTHVADDILIAVIEAGYSSPLTDVSGWTTLAREAYDPGAGDGTAHMVLWRRATSSSMPSLTVNTSNHAAGVVLSVRGCRNTGSPFRDVATAPATANHIPFPAVTTEESTDLLIFAGSYGIDSGSVPATVQAPSGGTGLSNMQTVTYASTTANDGGMAYVGSAEKLTPGNSGTPSATFGTVPGAQYLVSTTMVLAAVDL